MGCEYESKNGTLYTDFNRFMMKIGHSLAWILKIGNPTFHTSG